MEISDVLAALEELKNGIAAVKSANENVEKAANAARKVCEAFGACSAKLEGFPSTVMDPIKTKVEEIAEASAQMVRSCADSVEGLRTETKSIVDAFNATVNSSCSKIQNDVNEFHREIESLESKLTRVTDRVEEKTDGVVSEVRKQSKAVHDDLAGFKSSQETALDKVSADIVESKTALKSAVESLGDGLGKTMVKETARVSENVGTAKEEILSEVRSARKAAIVSAIIAFVSAASAVILVVKILGR